METLKTFDPMLALEQAGGSHKLADELFGMLLKELPSFDQTLRTAYASGDLRALEQTVHKLNGAAIYCGVPALKSAAVGLETSLKRGELGRLADELDTLLGAIRDVQRHSNGHRVLVTR